jgi:hypothetical protein
LYFRHTEHIPLTKFEIMNPEQEKVRRRSFRRRRGEPRISRKKEILQYAIVIVVIVAIVIVAYMVT